MFNLTNKEGHKLSIEVVDYEFPNREDTGGIPTEEELLEMEDGRDYDANWLMLKVTGYNGEDHWEAIDACMLTWELETLMEWFVRMANGLNIENISPNLFFLEECLTIYQRYNDDEDNYNVRFALAFEIAPPGEQSGTEYYMDFVLSREELAKMSEGVAMALAKFPAR